MKKTLILVLGTALSFTANADIEVRSELARVDVISVDGARVKESKVGGEGDMFYAMVDLELTVEGNIGCMQPIDGRVSLREVRGAKSSTLELYNECKTWEELGSGGWAMYSKMEKAHVLLRVEAYRGFVMTSKGTPKRGKDGSVEMKSYLGEKYKIVTGSERNAKTKILSVEYSAKTGKVEAKLL